MKFSTILTVIIIVYVLYYAWMIINDLFLKKEEVNTESYGDEDEIDISDESGNFQPRQVERTDSKKSKRQDEPSQQVPLIFDTCTIPLDDFLVRVDDFAENGQFSEMGQILSEWGAEVA